MEKNREMEREESGLGKVVVLRMIKAFSVYRCEKQVVNAMF